MSLSTAALVFMRTSRVTSADHHPPPRPRRSMCPAPRQKDQIHLPERTVVRATATPQTLWPVRTLAACLDRTDGDIRYRAPIQYTTAANTKPTIHAMSAPPRALAAAPTIHSLFMNGHSTRTVSPYTISANQLNCPYLPFALNSSGMSYCPRLIR